MARTELLQELNERAAKGQKSFAVLIDPDKVSDLRSLQDLIRLGSECKVDYFFVGGSFVTKNQSAEVIAAIKSECSTPVILFPGSSLQVETSADAILFLSLISGRNPEFLIGQHVQAAPILRNSQLEILPTGYMLVGEDQSTTVSYISNTTPIPNSKTSVGVCTAMAGEMLGLRIIYLDAGSGAQEAISTSMIGAIRQAISTPIIVGGGLTNADKALATLKAGADVIVIGNGIERSPDLLIDVSSMVADYNQKLKVH